MKERREVAMLKEPAKNSDVNGSGGLREIKEEVKEEVKGRSSRSTPDAKPSSNKMANGESDTPKSEDSNKNKIKTEAGIKEENGGPMSVGSDNKKSPACPSGGGGSQLCPLGTSQDSLHGFMQQQSRIFVFSTAMANKAAEAVKQGKCPNMITYHMEHPLTKQFLQKNPLKGSQYGRQPSSMPTYSQYPHNPSMMGKHGMGPGSGPSHMLGMGPGSGGPSGVGSVAQWVQQQNANLEEQAMGGMVPYPMNCGGMVPGGPNSRAMGWNHHGMPQGPQGPMGGPYGLYSMMDSMYEFNPDAVGPGGSVSMPQMNLSQNKVPNENLTPEQLERREEQLANLRKLGRMLFAGEQNPLESGMYMGSMSQQQQAMMSSPQHMMMSQQQAVMMGHPGMMSPSQQQYMMQQQQGVGMAGPYPPGHPASRGQGPGMPSSNMGQDMSPAQQAWIQMQHEFYEKKTHPMMQRTQPQSMMGGMGPQHPMDRGPMNGPPPPYYSTMNNKRQTGPMGMVGSSTSPGLSSSMMDPGDPLGMLPSSARGRPGMPMDPSGMEGMGPGFGPGMPGHSMGGMSGMCLGMPSMDPLMVGMGQQQPSPMSSGPLSSGPMSSGPMSSGPMPSGPMPSGPMSSGPMSSGPMPSGPMSSGPLSSRSTVMGGVSGVNVVSSTSGRKSAGLATLHRAGHPEPFASDSINNTGGSKPPPSYAQAQKRKREDLEDAYKHLQPTPSPTQLNYLNQFEGQELTITKQLNSAFRDQASGGGGSSGVTSHDPSSIPPPLSSHPHNTQFSSPASNSNPVNSPLTHGSSTSGNPPSAKGPMSNSSQTSSTGHLGSPSSLHHGPSPMSGANMRLSHFDPSSAANNPTNNCAVSASNNGSMSSAPATPTAGKQPAGLPQPSSSSSMSNITSASLANLAKGVEHLSNQMQQNMMQGGPFHSIQVQGQMGGSGGSSNSNGANVTTSSSNSQSSQQTQGMPAICQASSSQPVNNTFLSTNLQIGQVNIQNVTAGSNASMQVQHMTAESPHMSMAGGASSMVHGGNGNMSSMSAANGNMGSGGMMPPHMATHLHQQQQQAMSMGGGGGGMPGSTLGMSQSQHMQSVGAGIPSVNNNPMCTMAPTIPPSSHPAKSPPYTPHHPVPHPLPHPAMSTGIPQSQMAGSMGNNRLSSPPFPSSTMGNANVQIQPKAPNTIQYLPANPPLSQQASQPGMVMGGGPPPAKRSAPDMDFMPRYSSPMDMKNPSSTLQYFPSSPSHSMRHHSSSMGPGTPMSDYSAQQSMEMQQAMMMRGAPGGPGPQDYGPMGHMGQGMHPGMGMGPSIPVSASMSSQMGLDSVLRGMDTVGGMPGMGSPMESMMMGPGPNIMRSMSSMGPSGPSPMDPMSPPMMGPSGGSTAGSHYPVTAPSGYMPNGQSMLMAQHMQAPGSSGPPHGHPASMGGMPMSHPNMTRVTGPTSSMRMPMQGGPGPGSSSSGAYSAQYQQFQQQLYSQGRSRQMSPMASMMGGGHPGPGQTYMGMMPNMPGPS